MGLLKRRCHIKRSEFVLTDLTFSVVVTRSALVSGSSWFGAHEYPSPLPLWLFLLSTHQPALEWLMTKVRYHYLAKLFHLLGCLISLLESMLSVSFELVIQRFSTSYLFLNVFPHGSILDRCCRGMNFLYPSRFFYLV